MANDNDPTLQIIQQTVAGVKVWLAEFSAVSRSLFLPTGLQDWLGLTSKPANPPPGRIRSYVIDRVLQFVDENGTQGAHGELIATDANGTRRVVPPGTPGSLLIFNPEEPTSVAWGQALAVSDVQGKHQAGSLYIYDTLMNVTASEIQYTRIFLVKGLAITSMEVFLGLGGSGARNFNLGFYDQADPEDLDGVPVNRLAETGTTPTNSPTNVFRTIALGSPVVIPDTGFYWLAFISDTASPVTYNSTGGAFPQDFLPVRREAGAGTALPTVASGLSNPASSVAYVAALE